MSKPWSQLEMIKALAWRRDGISSSRIARRLGRSESEVRKLWEKAQASKRGLDVKPGPKPKVRDRPVSVHTHEASMRQAAHRRKKS